MFNGKNESGKEFDVIDADGDVIGSFDDMQAAVSCGRSAPWYHGKCNIRKDSPAYVAPKFSNAILMSIDWS